MAEKPTTAAGYRSDQVALARATLLYVATRLGDLIEEMVVVGGLVPSLLVDQEALPPETPIHVGTLDVDMGLTVALLSEGRYRTLSEALRRAGFVPDVNAQGRQTRQRWQIERVASVTVDFLIPPSLPDDKGGRIRNLERDFAAVIAPGLQVAFRDRELIELSGETVFGERATRSVWVCGPGAYVVLKALAFDRRGENKDAYDLYYLISNYGAGVADVAARLRPLLDDSVTSEALAILRRDFLAHDGVGPRRVADFLAGSPDDTIQADVVGYAGALLRAVS